MAKSVVDEIGRHAVLYPSIAEAAHRLGASAVGLIDVGRRAGLNLNVDRVGIAYSDGVFLGDPSSPVQASCSIVRRRGVPSQALPTAVAKVLLASKPLDVTDADDARELRSSLGPDDAERALALDAEIALAVAAPPTVVRGNPVYRLPDALALLPDGALPVVVTTWALVDLGLEDRQRFLHRLGDSAARRPIAWVSVEGVGVAPGVPTLGDRRASGHSLIGIALFEGRELRVETVGRCWSRGRMLSWLAAP